MAERYIRKLRKFEKSLQREKIKISKRQREILELIDKLTDGGEKAIWIEDIKSADVDDEFKSSTLFYSLRKLTEIELISRIETDDAGKEKAGRNRVYYNITDLGVRCCDGHN